MRKTIFLKTFVANLLVLSVFTILITLFTINTVKQWHINSLVKELKKNSILIEPIIKNYLNNKPEDLTEYITKLDKKIHTRITIIKNDGEVISDSQSEPEKMENHGERPEVLQAFKNKYAYNIRFSTTKMSKMLYFAIPLKTDDSIFGVLRTSVYIKDINNILAKLNKKIFLLIFFLFIVSIAITYFISKKISIPIIKISEASKNIEQGDFDVKIFVKDTGEIGDLANSFNSMVLYQKKLFKTLKRNQQELETVLSSINEGLAVVDIDGNIVLSNDNFFKNIDYLGQDTDGKRIWEIYRDPKLNSMIKDVFKNEKNSTEIIKIDDLFFKTSFNLIKEAKRIVITFHNITEAKRVEQIKKDFVLNASHELKTPLTSIKGFIETLEAEIPDKNKNYLNIIKRNSERLTHIVNDLLIINQLEDSDRFKTEIINLNRVINETIIIHQKEAEKKNIEFIIKEPSVNIKFRGDKYKIEDLIINLVNNAVKYTDKGKITISYGYEDKNNVFFKIKDTGIGIEKKNLQRVFERFYVTNKSRSRETGGTGLGLSIVKHIVNIHNGSINLESEPGSGSTFTIILPLNLD